MTPHEIKQLHKLLRKFSDIQDPVVGDPTKTVDQFNNRERAILLVVLRWVVYYAHDELSLDL